MRLTSRKLALDEERRSLRQTAVRSAVRRAQTLPTVSRSALFVAVLIVSILGDAKAQSRPRTELRAVVTDAIASYVRERFQTPVLIDSEPLPPLLDSLRTENLNPGERESALDDVRMLVRIALRALGPRAVARCGSAMSPEELTPHDGCPQSPARQVILVLGTVRGAHSGRCEEAPGSHCYMSVIQSVVSRGGYSVTQFEYDVVRSSSSWTVTSARAVFAVD